MMGSTLSKVPKVLIYLQPSNISGLLESAQDIIKTPWYLARNEEGDNVIKYVNNYNEQKYEKIMYM